MSRIERVALVAASLFAVCGCGPRPIPRVFLPDQPTTLAELCRRYPLAPGQSVRVDRLGVAANASYHFVQLSPGAGERPHLHAQHDLAVTMLRGGGTQWIRDHALPLQAGDSAVIPAGTPHRFVNTGDTPAAALVIFSPPHDGSDQVFLDGR
ncbi:MAG TPA: cupin domain-containing protein [Candidatus Binatia bacterium]|nr:cupin domain-containing protein [Candidatus Binatia bacterium]